MSKHYKLDFVELDMMSIGMVLDHIMAYSDIQNSNSNNGNKTTVRKATQADINALKI